MYEYHNNKIKKIPNPVFVKYNLIKTFKRNSVTSTQCLKTAQKSLIFASEASNISKKTFGESFLPLVNSFRSYQILDIYSIKWSEIIWENFQGAKTNHQRFPR